jgi:RNA polymerase sigma-70 factor (ECF subfamily)
MIQDSDLIIKAQQGDIAAFTELVHRHDRNVLALAARYVDNAEDAKDIYQEVMIRVFRGLPAFRFKSEFSTWLHSITVNACLSHRTRFRKERSIMFHDSHNPHPGDHAAELVSPERGPDQEAASANIASHVRRALDTLSARQRVVFTLRHYDGRSLKEIAQTLRCSEGAVKRYLYDATRRLREELTDIL